MLKKSMVEKAKFIPKAGFNVVGVDGFELPGEQLYLVGHFDDEPAAVARAAKFQKENPDEAVYVYGVDTQ